MVGEVVEKKRAREIYDSYKQKRRDPGPARAGRLPDLRDAHLPDRRRAPSRRCRSPTTRSSTSITTGRPTSIRWPRPRAARRTRARRAASRSPSTCNRRCRSRSWKARAIASAFVIAKHADGYRQASLETKGGSLARRRARLPPPRPQTGIDLITSTRAGEDGYFCLTLTAGEELRARTPAWTTSSCSTSPAAWATTASCCSRRIASARSSTNSAREDRFEVMTFNVQPTLAFNTKRGADAQRKAGRARLPRRGAGPRRHRAQSGADHRLQVRRRRSPAQRRDPERRPDRAERTARSCSS